MRALLGCLLLPALLLAALVWLATDARPSLSRPASLSLADLERGKALVDSLGLRHMREGESRQLLLSEDELDRAVNYLSARLAKGSASAHIALGQLVVRAALPLPLGGRYLNVELALVPEGAVLAPAELRLGRLPVPAFVAGDLVAWSLGLSPYSEGLAAARELLDSARLVGPTWLWGSPGGVLPSKGRWLPAAGAVPTRRPCGPIGICCGSRRNGISPCWWAPPSTWPGNVPRAGTRWPRTGPL